jgi:hypothetical protein
MKTKFSAIALLTVLLLVAACGGSGAASTQPAAPASSTTSDAQPTATTAIEVIEPTATTAAQAAQAVQPTATVEPAIEATPTQGAEADLNVGSVSGGLNQLKSYKSKLTAHFLGTDAEGQSIDKLTVMEEEFVREPPAQHIFGSTTESIGTQPATTTHFDMVIVNQTMYLTQPDDSGAQACMALSSDAMTSTVQALSPTTWWSSISGGKYLNSETVNGLKAKHYALKQDAFAQADLSTGQGEVWVAADGGWVIKLTFEGTGTDPFSDGADATGETGTSTFQWDVTGINTSLSIVAPTGCEGAATDIPMMADAKDKTSNPVMISYTSASALVDVVAFYKAEMPKAGWQASGTPQDVPGYAILTYTKDTRTATVTVTTDPTKQVTMVQVYIVKP